MIDYTKTSKEILTQLISDANGLHLNAAQLSFDAPQINEDAGAVQNTKVTAHGVPGQGTSDHAQFTYDRVNINTVPGSRSRVFAGAGTLVSQLVPQVNLAYEIQLTEEDFVEAALPETGAVQLGIKPTSLVWVGELQLTLEALPAV